MSDRYYPNTLPLFEIGWSVKPSANWIISRPERGPSKRRLLTTAQSKVHSGKCVMTQGQLDEFIDFWDYEINGGIDSFLYPDYISGPGDWMEVRFADVYSYTQNGDGRTFTLNISLEILP